MDRKAAHACVAAWLTEIGRSAAGKALKRLITAAPKLEALLLGLADGSPYLWDLAAAEPERLLALLNSNPDVHLAELLAKAAKAVAATKDEAASDAALAPDEGGSGAAHCAWPISAASGR